MSGHLSEQRNEALERGLAQLRKATELAVGYQPQFVTRAEASAVLDHIEALQAQHDRLLAFVDAVSPFVRDVLDEPFPWQVGGQVITWMSRAEYDEALAALGGLRD